MDSRGCFQGRKIGAALRTNPHLQKVLIYVNLVKRNAEQK